MSPSALDKVPPNDTNNNQSDQADQSASSQAHQSRSKMFTDQHVVAPTAPPAEVLDAQDRVVPSSHDDHESDASDTRSDTAGITESNVLVRSDMNVTGEAQETVEGGSYRDGGNLEEGNQETDRKGKDGGMENTAEDEVALARPTYERTFDSAAAARAFLDGRASSERLLLRISNDDVAHHTKNDLHQLAAGIFDSLFDAHAPLPPSAAASTRLREYYETTQGQSERWIRENMQQEEHIKSARALSIVIVDTARTMHITGVLCRRFKEVEATKAALKALRDGSKIKKNPRGQGPKPKPFLIQSGYTADVNLSFSERLAEITNASSSNKLVARDILGDGSLADVEDLILAPAQYLSRKIQNSLGNGRRKLAKDKDRSDSEASAAAEQNPLGQTTFTQDQGLAYTSSVGYGIETPSASSVPRSNQQGVMVPAQQIVSVGDIGPTQPGPGGMVYLSMEASNRLIAPKPPSEDGKKKRKRKAEEVPEEADSSVDIDEEGESDEQSRPRKRGRTKNGSQNNGQIQQEGSSAGLSAQTPSRQVQDGALQAPNSQPQDGTETSQLFDRKRPQEVSDGAVPFQSFEGGFVPYDELFQSMPYSTPQPRATIESHVSGRGPFNDGFLGSQDTQRAPVSPFVGVYGLDVPPFSSYSNDPIGRESATDSNDGMAFGSGEAMLEPTFANPNNVLDVFRRDTQSSEEATTTAESPPQRPTGIPNEEIGLFRSVGTGRSGDGYSAVDFDEFVDSKPYDRM